MRISLFLALLICFPPIVFSQDLQTGMSEAPFNLSQYLINAQRKVTELPNIPTEITEFNNAPNTLGKRFFFDHWVSADSIVLAGKGLLLNNQYLFNYDKLTSSLIGTENKTNIVAANASAVHSFILNDGGKHYRFVKLKPTDSRFSLELVPVMQRYSLYKKTTTTLKKADFRSDGLIQTGSRDDEFKDANEYYVKDNSTGKIEQVYFRAKSIRQTLPGEKAAIDKYFRNNWEKHLDEEFLVGLVNYINGL